MEAQSSKTSLYLIQPENQQVPRQQFGPKRSNKEYVKFDAGNFWLVLQHLDLWQYYFNLVTAISEDTEMRG